MITQTTLPNYRFINQEGWRCCSSYNPVSVKPYLLWVNVTKWPLNILPITNYKLK